MKRERLILIGLTGALLIAVVVSLTIGRYAMSPGQIAAIVGARLFGGEMRQADAEANLVLFIIRVPRILLTIMVGAALSASGAAFQGLFKNPMVSPDILGVSSAAGAGAAVAILIGLSSVGVNIVAFCFGVLAVLLVLTLAQVIGRGNGALLIMVLSGVVVSSLFRAFTSLTKYLADADNKLPEITFWLMGSFAKSGGIRGAAIMLSVLILGGTPLLALRWRLNVLGFGEEEAKAMGMNVKQIRLVIIACATLLTASSVCLCGNIEWVGLIMPHITRLLTGPDYRILLPAAMLGGGLFMLIVDNFCRAVIPGELPVGIVTSIIGAPLFIYMLFKGRREWA
jgi:iron complex transport system permease protein